jgi:uncharacterized protein (TIGR02246 family)
VPTLFLERIMRSTVALCALLALAACQAAETPEQAAARMAAESATGKAEIDEINVRYARYMNANQADSIATLFMEDGVLMPPSSPAVVGRDAIRAHMAATGMPPGATLGFTAVDVAANGPILVERGTYTFTMPAQGSDPAVSIPGKYLVHWHKVNGQWLQAATIWSDDVPPPPPAT